MPKSRAQLFAMFQAQTGRTQMNFQVPKLDGRQITGYQPPRMKEYKWRF